MESTDFEEMRISSRMQGTLSEVGTLRKFDEGDVILNENAFIKAIPVVKKGSVRVMRTDEDGRELLLYYIKPGETCIMSFLGGMHQGASKVKAVAEGETDVLFVPVDKMKLLIAEYPEWLDYVFRLYHQRFVELLDVVNAVAFRKMDERLLDYIRRKCDVTKSKSLYVTHEQIASELGTARVVVSRLLKQMEEVGLVKLGRNKISLV